MHANNTHEGIRHTDLWTCGTWRSFNQRSQNDFLLMTNDFQGSSQPYSLKHPWFRRSHHRPILGSFRFNRASQYLPQRCCAPSRTRWAPTCPLQFKDDTLKLLAIMDLKQFQAGLQQIVDDTQSITNASKSRTMKKSANAEIKSAKFTCCQCHGHRPAPCC